MNGLGSLLDAAACGISGHIWVVNTGIDGVMVCSRCNAHEDAPPAPEVTDQDDPANLNDAVDTDDSSSLIAEHRPWLDPPYTYGA